MYPNDAKTFFLNVSANGTSGTLLPSVNHVRTILNLGMSCNTGNLNSIKSGTQEVVYIKNNSNIYKNVIFQQPINTPLTYTKTNNADCFFTIVYADYDLSTMGTGAPAFYSGDGLFMSLLLLILVIFAIIDFVWLGIRSVGVHKKYMGVNQLEGKELYDI